jgi:hypothetical protein
MLNRLNQVSVAAPLPDFVTLTFPDDSFRDSVTEFAQEAKSYLDTWLKRLRRVAPSAAGFWRMEWQARKSGPREGKLFPHFHLMVWNLPKRELHFGVTESYVLSEDLQEGFAGLCKEALERCEWASLRKVSRFHDRLFLHETRPHCSRPDTRYMSFFDWASASWYHVVGSHNLDHFRAGVSVERVRSWGGVMCYCSKYMAKLGDNNFLSEVPVGRSWGIFNKLHLPWAKLIELPLPEDIGVRVRRIMRKYIERVRGRRRSAPYGLVFYGDVAQWSRLWEPPPDTPF